MDIDILRMASIETPSANLNHLMVGRSHNLILGSLSKKLTTQQRVLFLAELDHACNAEQEKLNGNNNRRVIGLISKNNRLSKEGTGGDNKSYNVIVDKKQADFLKSVGAVPPPYLLSTVVSFKGKDRFRHNPNLTYAFEVLRREAAERNEVLAFITVQLNKDVTGRLHAKDSPVSDLRKIITYRLKKLLSGDLKALIVLERSQSVIHETSHSDSTDSDSTSSLNGLHVHIVLVGKKKEIESLKDVTKSFSLRSISTPASNAVVIQYDYECRRLDEEKDGLRSDCILITRLPIDGSLMDYLSKELDRPISSCGNQNFAFIGIQGAVRLLWIEMYEKQIKLNESVLKIKKEIADGIHPGNIRLRLRKVLEE